MKGCLQRMKCQCHSHTSEYCMIHMYIFPTIQTQIGSSSSLLHAHQITEDLNDSDIENYICTRSPSKCIHSRYHIATFASMAYALTSLSCTELQSFTVFWGLVGSVTWKCKERVNNKLKIPQQILECVLACASILCWIIGEDRIVRCHWSSTSLAHNRQSILHHMHWDICLPID